MPNLTSAERRPDLYQPVAELETPSLVVDLDVMERNIREFVAFADENDVTLRSHVKTHKNADIAALQQRMSDGGGVMCQTLGETEIMARNGLSDVYLSYQVVGERKLDRVVWLSEKLDSFATTVDARGNIEPLQTKAAERDTEVGVLLEIDIGLGRTGAPPGEKAVELAAEINQSSHLDFRGLLAYDAHVKAAASTRSDFQELCWGAMETTQETVELIEDAGISVDEVEAGGTATSKYCGKHPVVTEINPGMYPFNDVGELELRPFDISKGDCAAMVISTVISAPSDDRVVVDAGSKTLSLDKPQMPVARNRDDIEYANASEEHGWIDTSESSRSFEIGDRIEFIVPHVCTTINLHDTIVGVRDDRVEELWDVQARGKVK